VLKTSLNFTAHESELLNFILQGKSILMTQGRPAG
jgi:hypothetical protein